MKNKLKFFLILMPVLVFNSACTTINKNNDLGATENSQEILYVYDDGRMKLDSRYVDSKDVVIYSDGQGGEKAAVKVYVPIHPDFYRDSITVVRVVKKFEESISQQESEEVDNIN